MCAGKCVWQIERERERERGRDIGSVMKVVWGSVVEHMNVAVEVRQGSERAAKVCE